MFISDSNFLGVAGTLLAHLIEASKAAQHNVPDLIRDKMSNLLKHLAKILENLAPRAMKATEKKNKSAFLEFFLSLCISYGEMLLMMHHYSEQPDLGTVVDETLLDFSLLLPFVPNWQDFALEVLQIEACRPLIVSY